MLRHLVPLDPRAPPFQTQHTMTHPFNANLQGCVSCDGNASQCSACQMDLDGRLNFYVLDPITKTCAAFPAHLS